jgi:hypothetical protein
MFLYFENDTEKCVLGNEIAFYVSSNYGQIEGRKTFAKKSVSIVA